MQNGHNPAAVRYLLLATHYRQQLNFTRDGLEAAKASITRLRDFRSNIENARSGPDSGPVKIAVNKAIDGFEAGMDDDLNISPALAAVFDFVRDINAAAASDGLSESDRELVLAILRRFDSVLGIIFQRDERIDEDIEKLINKRIEAKKKKDFAAADSIRSDLLSRGIILEDTPSGTKWKRKV